MTKAGFSAFFTGAILLIFAVACGGGGEDPATTTPASTPTPTPTSIPATATPPATTAPTPKLRGTPPSVPSETQEPVDDLVALGRELYLNPPPNVGEQALWCSDCHLVEGITQGLIGPDHTHLGTQAADRKPGLSAEEYIRESIMDPEVFISPDVERATAGLMVTSITEGLTNDQVDALVAFLLAQK